MKKTSILAWLAVLAGLVISLAALALFIRISEAVFSSKVIDRFDWQIMTIVQNAATGPMINRLMIMITWFGSFPTYLLLSAGAGLRLWRRGRRREAVLLLVCLTGAHFLNLGLKLFYRRPRPDFFPLIRTGGYSFPSGHAMVSLPFYGFLAYAGSRHSPLRGSGLVGLSVLLTLAIGVSRIYLGVHWPSDVLAGYAVGAIWLVSCIFATEISLNLHRRKHLNS